MRYNWRKMSKKARLREEVQKKSIELTNSLPKHNELAYLTVQSPEYATHWVAKKNDEGDMKESFSRLLSGITKDAFYRLYLDQYKGSHIILNNDKEEITLSNQLPGEFVILEGSDHWWFHVEELWRKEWEQTDAYKEMIRQSVQAMREDEGR